MSTLVQYLSAQQSTKCVYLYLRTVAKYKQWFVWVCVCMQIVFFITQKLQ